jgi:hypothetical protein
MVLVFQSSDPVATFPGVDQHLGILRLIAN